MSAFPPSTPSIANLVMSSGPLVPVGGDDTSVVLGKVVGPLEAKEVSMLGNTKRPTEETMRMTSRDVCVKNFPRHKEFTKLNYD